MEYEICKKCERKLNGYFCEQPCGDFFKYLDQMSYLSYSNDNVINEKKSMSEENGGNESSNPHEIQISSVSYDNDISGFLNFDIEDDEWLEILNHRLTIEKVIDTDELFMYMDALNKDYCNEHNLCHECRRELVEVNDPRGEYFGTPVSEKILICPKCG